MNIRRIVAALAATAALVPVSGSAIGEAERTVPGSSCTVGKENLVFNGEVGQWEGRASVTCPLRADGSPSLQAQIDMNFVVTHVQGVGTFPEPGLTGPATFTSKDPTTGVTTYSCIACPSLQSFGTYLALSPGLYMMKASAVITQNTQAGTVYRRGNHATCFLVRGEASDMVTPVPGCTL
ncbi:MAG: hypothetical protein ACRDJM_09915 [Actinomycetota bacterium]